MTPSLPPPVQGNPDVLAGRQVGASAAHADFLQRRYFGSFDGLRGLAVAAVVWHHTGATAYRDSTLLQNGDYGVQLFFALSGFLIATLLLREGERDGRVDLRAFYLRRTLRIFPLYYAVLALYTLLVLAVERDTAAGARFLSNLPYFLTYTSNYFVPSDGRVIFYFAWSLAAEEQFYLVWPALQCWVSRRLALTGLVAVALLALAQQHAPQPFFEETSTLGALAAHVAVPILLGVLAAHVLHVEVGFAVAWRWLGRRWGAPLVGVVLLGALAHPWTPVFVVHGLFVLLVVSTALREDHGLAPLLGQRWLRDLGIASYGVYLLHMLCANVVRRALDVDGASSPLLVFGGTLGLAWALGALSHRTFERWFLSLGPRGRGTRFEPGRAAAPAAATKLSVPGG